MSTTRSKRGALSVTFAETVDEGSESSPVPASVGEALREKFQKVGKISTLPAFRTELCWHALKLLQARVQSACEWSCRLLAAARQSVLASSSLPPRYGSSGPIIKSKDLIGKVTLCAATPGDCREQ